MFGQWIGAIHGTNEGSFVLNVDEDRPNSGLLQVNDGILPLAAAAALELSGSTITGRLTNFFASRPTMEGETLPQSGEISGELNGNAITGSWSTDAASNGTFEAERFDDPKAPPPDKTLTWAEFRDWALGIRQGSRDWLFRGQSSSKYPLLTTFHRSGRRNLVRYNLDDLPQLHRAVEASLGKRLDLDNKIDYGIFLSLAQHHGFPTPLLDWTVSPFVAAYFAFRRVPKVVPADRLPVRIFAFDSAATRGQGFTFGINIDDIGLIFSPKQFSARYNPRALPQQSVSIFTNIVDIEKFLGWHAEQMGKQLLLRIDIPASERAAAKRDLETMGISAASLFPGLDGVCQATAEERF